MGVLWPTVPTSKTSHRWLHDEVDWHHWPPQAGGAGADSTSQALWESLGASAHGFQALTRPLDKPLLSPEAGMQVCTHPCTHTHVQFKYNLI